MIPCRLRTAFRIRDLALAMLLMLGSADVLAASADAASLVEEGLERATVGPGGDTDIGGAVTYIYEPHLHYQIFTRPLHVTDIQLEPGETLTGDIAAGDTARWQVAISHSGTGAAAVTHLQVKPLKAGLSTNFVVTTDRRSYAFLAESSKTAFMPLVRFRYSKGITVAAAATRRPTLEAPSRSELAETFQFEYRFRPKRRQRAWAPVAVFQDGAKTYLKFSNLKKAPVLFAVQDRKETLVNYRVVRDLYVVDQVLDQMLLKQGPKDKLRIRRKVR